jgi:hypothetical protein
MFTGCAKLPRQEIDAAKAACESAQAAQANVFAAERFNAAQGMMNTALADIKVQQNTRSVFARNYDKTQKTLVDAIAAFDSSKTAAATSKAAIKQEATVLLEKIRATKGESEKLVLILIKKRNGDVAAYKSRLESVTAKLPADLGAVNDNDLIATRDLIKNALVSVDSVKVSLEQLAIAKSAMIGGRKLISKVGKTDKAEKSSGRIHYKKGKK